MEKLVRRGPLQWGMACGEWLTFQDERKAQYPGWWFEHEVPEGTSVRVLEDAVAVLVERHEILRTTFDVDEDGCPEQRVWSPERVEVHALEQADPDQLQAFRTRDFLVDSEWPCRFGRVLRGTGAPALLACFSHIVVDNRAKEILKQDLAVIMDAVLAKRSPDLPPVEWQPLDYALYERSEKTAALRRRAEEYWAGALDRIPVATFNIGEAPETVRYVDCRSSPRSAAGQLERIAQKLDAPMNSVFAGVFSIALGGATAQEVVPLDVTTHGRVTRNALNVVAPLARAVIIPSVLLPDQSFGDFARGLHRLTFQANRYSMVDTLEYTEWRAVMSGRKGGEIGSRIALNFMYKQEGGHHAADAPSRSGPQWESTVSDPVEYRSFSHHLYVAASGSGARLEFHVSGNEAVIGRGNTEVVARSITDLLDHLDKDPDRSIGGLRGEIAGLVAAPSRDPIHGEPVISRGDAFRPDFIDAALQTHAGVKEARTRLEEGALVTEAAVSEPSLTEAELIAFLKSKRSYRAVSRTIPDRIRVERPETSADSSTEQNAAASDAASALIDCVRTVNRLGSVDAQLSYAECGGRFFRIPAVLRRLRGLGYEGLNRNDLQMPCSLTILAGRLGPAQGRTSAHED
ncbi:condensation domain-containing protein [Glycomyces buryatensis]|nr:condensation domain-containing protein [Glycomyces buryatensis]